MWDFCYAEITCHYEVLWSRFHLIFCFLFSCLFVFQLMLMSTTQLLLVRCYLLCYNISALSPHGLLRHQKYHCSSKTFVSQEYNFLNITLQCKQRTSQALQINVATKNASFLKQDSSNVALGIAVVSRSDTFVQAETFQQWLNSIHEILYRYS